jgi:outer membrane lipoprotein-sorting protein
MRLLTLVTLVAVLTACGGQEESGLDGDVPVEDILGNASTRLAETESVRFRMEIDGSTYIDQSETLRLLNARGTMARPDRVDVEFQIEVAGAPKVSIRMITIGENAWTTDIVTGRWVEAQEEFGYNPSVLYDNQNGLGPVMGKLTDPELIGVEDLDGTQTYHIRGTATQDVIDPLTSGTMHGETITVDVWIDGESWNLMKVTVAEPTDAGLEDPATWNLTLGDHDEQVTIERPE